ncbi:DUF2075 domain-containing protein [Nocardia sp. BMG111209]|uniref:DUF2075 domain-containing protein n=1 Tax=Nocardia sp. BMG111209 TaxID=1160137 RepID=UPI001E40145C|nr:DUF2075 domain-containing protein [Nocardia sp. BMG111209]
MPNQVYRSTAEEVLALPADQQLSAIIAAHLGRVPRARPTAEQRSWDRSLPAIAGDLADVGLEQIEMLVEYRLPSSSLRPDVILSGTHPQTGADNYVVVELKQWSAAELAWNSDRIVRVPRLAGEHLHPIDQVRGYCRYLSQYVDVLHDRPDAVHGVAYLHNATENSVSALRVRQPDDRGRMFTGEQRDEFLTYLKSQFAPGSGTGAADRLLSSAVRPRPDLFGFTSAELRAATEYSLLGRQELAYEAVMSMVRRAQESDAKSVVIVTGGPGSGKSIIAVSLLAELHRQGLRVAHATGSSAFTESLRKFPGRGSKELQTLFQYFRTFADYRRNQLDVLICDEAHRIREVSTNRFTPKQQRTKRPQVDELMAAARVPVFLLDEHQVVRPGEVGTVHEIRSHAARSDYVVHHIELDGQFRCGGSAAYDEWVLRLLDLRAGGPTAWPGDPAFEIRIAPSPREMENFLRDKNSDGWTARIAAGYCWPWSSPEPDGTLVNDVVIGDWSMPWNLRGIRAVGDAPPSPVWASDPRGFGQVGCIYTAQGFEYDWAGVIIGPDLVVRNGHLVSVREGNQDKALKHTKSNPVSDETFDKSIRNIYKVLLTRGMRGVVIHAVDAETQEFLTGLVEPAGSGGNLGR